MSLGTAPNPARFKWACSGWVQLLFFFFSILVILPVSASQGERSMTVVDRVDDDGGRRSWDSECDLEGEIEL